MSKIGLRKAWFQVHKWIGLILAVLIIPVSLSGSALVWREPIERAMHPERYAVTGSVNRPITAYASAAQTTLAPRERLQRIELPSHPGEPVIATATKPGKGRPQRVTVYVDPATGHVLSTARSGQGAMQVIHMLHGSLTVPGVGRKVVGWIGVAMLVMAVSGLWLWWPLVGSLRRGLRWKRHPNLETNLHHQIGFWISVPLFVLSLTGVWIAFPQVFSGSQGEGGSGGRAAALALPVAAADAAIARAEQAAGGRAVAVAWPTDRAREWSVSVKPQRGRPVTVTVGAADLLASVKPAGSDRQPRTVARLMRQIHDGNDLPFVWQLIIFLGGIIPAVLAVTGIIMWWRARGWRGEVGSARLRRAPA